MLKSQNDGMGGAKRERKRNGGKVGKDANGGEKKKEKSRKTEEMTGMGEE